jgi:hypothetical protein
MISCQIKRLYRDPGFHGATTIFTYGTWPIPRPGSASTSLAALGRRFGHVDGLDRACSGLFAKRPLIFLGILPRSEKRARGLGRRAPEHWRRARARSGKPPRRARVRGAATKSRSRSRKREKSTRGDKGSTGGRLPPG